MTVRKPGWQRSLKGWAIASTIFPFLIFGLLELFELTPIQKAIVIVGGSLLWLFVLLPFFIMDWDDKRRERIMEICASDALQKLWQVFIDIKEDGSSGVERKIVGVNFADKREYYELESWTDPERDPTYERNLKEERKMLATVIATHKGKSIVVCKNGEFPPQQANRVNRIVHLIPVAKQAPLEPNDKFEITFIEKTERGTWKMQLDNETGDFYQHRVRHITEKLRFELILPKEWDFPRNMVATEKLAKGEMKDPSCGMFVETSGKPEVSKAKGRWKIVWEIEFPKLLSIYRLTYHPMVRR